MVKILPLVHSVMFYNSEHPEKKVSFSFETLQEIEDPEQMYMFHELIEEETEAEMEFEEFHRYLESF